MFECEAHVRGHRTEKARDACLAAAKRREERAERLAADVERRLANRRAESEYDYIRRRYCRDGSKAETVAASLNKDYPKREKPWGWADVITVHAEHLNWPTTDQLQVWLKEHPNVMLPSEVRKYAGVSAESHLER